MLRKIFGLKTEEVTSDWTIVHSEDLYDLYFPLNTFRVTEHEELDGRCLLHVCIRKEIHTGI